jgi:hypothetical protein
MDEERMGREMLVSSMVRLWGLRKWIMYSKETRCFYMYIVPIT